MNKELVKWSEVPFTRVEIKDAFWKPKLEIVNDVTLKACLEKCEETGRIANFAKAAGLMEGKHQGIYFDDSDVYKVLEGAAYLLMSHPDPILEEKIDEIIELIAGAQEEDGYLCTYYTLEKPNEKWTDMEKHEMYCGGHLIEAAIAYFEATGKRQLLDVACKLADHYDHLFGSDKQHWVEGHQEIELALIKLYRVTGEERYWKFALWLLEERGHGYGVGAIWDKEDWGPAYCQDDVPVAEIREVKGHAVRAMYLYTAMADATSVSGKTDYLEAMDAVWKNAVERNMYLTGGIGSSAHNEGFTKDYDLPNESAYCETCASIGMVLWNQRMNLLLGDGKYADVIEREIYNGILSGISLSGDKFFYVNPLASKGDHHRTAWYDVSCCPTNLVRFLPSIGNYVYANMPDGVAVNLYMNSEAEIKVNDENHVRMKQTTQYPWNGRIELSVQPEKEEVLKIKLRIPGWCRGYKVRINDEELECFEVEKGYAVLKRQWKDTDKITLELDMSIEIIRAIPEVEENAGLIALQRGPLVYCLEQTDNKGLNYGEAVLSANEPLIVSHDTKLLHGITKLAGKGKDNQLYTFIPYYAWDNREPGFMQVWIREARNNSLYQF